jgi:hypothetical protein
VATITRLRVNSWTVGVLLAAFFMGLYGGALRAQSTNASVTGYITDPTKAVIVGAKVIVINVDTNGRYEATTNGVGSYDVPNLPPGHYRIEVEKPGFKTVVKSDLILHVQDTAAINFEMALGSQSEIVTVQAGGLVINTTDATVATVVDRNFAENLPLNGRSFQTLILLTPGTVLTAPPAGGGNGGTFSVNGQRANANSFTVDGVSANGGGYLYQSNLTQDNGANPNFVIAGTTQGMVAVDALQEFKIQTSTYSPEFGRQPGGQVSLLTRSGTNAFHGTGFDYLRNTVFDASNWFNNQRGIPKGAERQNDFGGTLGGPIVKDKTFFFFSYEGLRLLVPQTTQLTVPSLCLRGTGPCAGGESPAAQAFQPILNSWPVPDGPESYKNGNPTGGAPYTDSQSAPTNLDSYGIRIDHTLQKRVHLFARYAYTSASTSDVRIPSAFLANMEWRGLTLGTDVGIRPNLENELRLNYTVNVSTPHFQTNPVGGATPFDSSILYPAPLIASRDGSSLLINLPNSNFTVDTGVAGKFSQRQAAIVDNTSWSVGSHQLKWGIDYKRLFPIYAYHPLQGGLVITSLSDLENGMVSKANLTANLVAHPIFVNFSSYALDTWRLSNRLTLTYGLRWDLNPTPGERNGLQPLNIIGVNDPATAALAPLNSAMYKTTYDNLAPRIGAAYQIRTSPGHETILRGGFGVFYDLDSEGVAQGFHHAPFSNISRNVRAPFPLAPNFVPVPQVPVPLTPPYGTITAIDPNLRLPYTLQWNVSLEQALGSDQSLTASYVAASGRRLLRSDGLFDINPNFTFIFLLRNASSSNYQSLQLQFKRRLSHGLQALMSYTYSHSIDNASDGEVLVAESASGVNFVNPNIDRGSSSFDLRHALRAAVMYDIPTWRANFLSKAALGGWSTDLIGIAQSALPVDLIGQYYFPANFPDSFIQLRPNVVPGIPLYLHGAQCTAANGGVPCPGGMAFNFTPGAVVGGCPDGSQSTGPFCPVPTDANGSPTQLEGTLGRNAMRGFGAWQVDFAVHRQFNLTERVNLQFRSEFFNVFNHPNFGSPFNDLTFSIFGLSRSTLNNSLGSLNHLYQIGGPRSIQLALKLQF